MFEEMFEEIMDYAMECNAETEEEVEEICEDMESRWNYRRIDGKTIEEVIEKFKTKYGNE